MSFQKQIFIREILDSPRRKVLPIMTSPGAELLGLQPRDVFQSGELQFQCIKALAATEPMDAQVTFMDLSVEAEAFGAPIAFSDYENPTVTAPIANTEESVNALRIPEPGEKRTKEVLQCAKLCAEHLERPTFGGLIGPYSLAGRLADMTEMMILAASEPEVAHALLRKTTDFLKQYIQEFRKTGIAGVMIAEPAAGLLSPEMCREFAADYLKEIVAAAKSDSFFVILHNCGKTEKQVDALLSTGADALHIGNAVDVLDILPQVPHDIPVMGNLDPVGVFKTMTEQQVYEATVELLKRTAAFPNFVLSSGCDLPPAIPMKNIRAFLNALNDYNQKAGA